MKWFRLEFIKSKTFRHHYLLIKELSKHATKSCQDNSDYELIVHRRLEASGNYYLLAK